MIDAEFYEPILLGLLALCLILLVLVIYLYIKIKRILLGKNAKSLEDSLVSLDKDLKTLQGFRKELETYLRSVETRLRKSIQGVETVRFNPFRGDGSGGNQSFATSFINENGDGVVISSLYSRERVSVFSKPVKDSKSEFELTAEEKTALEKARNSANKK